MIFLPYKMDARTRGIPLFTGGHLPGVHDGVLEAVAKRPALF
jgi:hypothetical protein